MNAHGFDDIAARYERDSLIQRSAADRLIGLLAIGPGDDVLDLGCGTGGLTRRLRELTDGKVAGIDPAEGMVREAEARGAGLDITFTANSAEALDLSEAFTVIFCNSAFQWFRDPAGALKNCLRALRQGGRMGIQAPAKQAYCPNFLEAIGEVVQDERTAGIVAGFRQPWFFLESAEDYGALFRDAGFDVPFARIETVTTHHRPEEVMAIFESGAAAGYLNQEHYATKMNAGYAAAFREIVARSFRKQANDEGMVGLVFNRIYLMAVK